MSKPKKIDLNKYTNVKSEDELYGYHSVIIIPAKLSDGTQLPPLYFRGGEEDLIIDVTDAEWTKDCKLCTTGSQEEYNKRINWWFEQAMLNPDYRSFVNETFHRLGFNVKESWEKGRAWLMSQVGSKRKGYIHKFIWNWMKQGYQWHMRRLEKERSNGTN